MALTKVSYSMINGAVVNVLDYGATGNGVTDDTVAIQAAATVANASKSSLYFPAGTYKVTSPITISGIDISGDGKFQSTVVAANAIETVFQITGGISVQSIGINGDGLANYCIKFSSCNGSILQSCFIENAVYDCVQYMPIGNNSNSVIDNCLIRIAGKEYTTGTATGNIGDTTITITGAVDLTTLGFRNKMTYVYFADDSSGIAYEVNVISSNTLSIYPALESTFSGSSYKIVTGSCVNIVNHSDNSCISIRNSTLQAGKCAGLEDKALYAANSINNVIEGNGYGRIIGQRGSGSDISYCPTEIGNYYELSSYKDILYAYVGGNAVAIPGINGAQGTTYKVFSGSASPVILANTAQSVIPANGIAFPAVAVSSDDPNTLDDYEEGTWTPVDGSAAALTFTANAGKYTKIGRQVTASCTLTYPSTATINAAYISGLPFNQSSPAGQSGGYVSVNTSATPIAIAAYSANVVQPLTLNGLSVGNSSFSGKTIAFTFIYTV